MQVLDDEQDGQLGGQPIEQPAQHPEQAGLCERVAGGVVAIVAAARPRPNSGTSRASSPSPGPTSVSKAPGSSSRASRRNAAAIGA